VIKTSRCTENFYTQTFENASSVNLGSNLSPSDDQTSGLTDLTMWGEQPFDRSLPIPYIGSITAGSEESLHIAEDSDDEGQFQS
jgi:hypothetical protein